ncbi:MAG: YibE/F family protein [Oscillospiraceae bacterium]|nr:YibE/F family protein [Oscillospiraceae bacterium]
MKKINTQTLRYYAPVAAALIIIVILLLVPTGFENKLIYRETERVAARVISTDDSMIIDTGLVRSGEQSCEVEFLSGTFKGQTFTAVNMLSGSLEIDKVFAAGDVAYARISHRNGEILSVSLTDHYRLPWELLLVGIFVAALILFAGQTGVRAVLSFILTILMIWKIVVPLYLNGVSPIFSGIAITALLSIMIVSLVYGFDRRAAASSLGIIIGLSFTAALGAVFTRAMNIHGAVMTGSESLLYCGFQHLNLTEIFMAAIFIGSSGAMMDLAVDITSAVDEVIRKKPEITPWEAVKSGITVGRAAMGTITTTLLLAYSGSCIAQLMVFMAQGTPLDCILNYKYIAAELIHTVAGSFGIVAVAPVTALASGLLLARHEER